MLSQPEQATAQTVHMADAMASYHVSQNLFT